MALLRSVSLAVVLATAAVLAAPRPAGARTCGGAVRCGCGDRVTASTTLDRDLGVCTGSGLVVASGVVLDCAGHAIVGNDTSNARFGIHVDGATGAEVRNCRVSGFRRGLRINGGSGNALVGNESFANKYGIDLAGGTGGNVLQGNLVRDSRDEGVHLGESDDNVITGNEIRYSKRENLYLLRSHRNRVDNNVVHHGRQSAIYVKHSSDNRFVHNEVRDTALQVRGDSTGNSFTDNYLKGDGYLFQAYQEPTGWTFPHGNVMSGDCIRKTSSCYRFFGAYDNHATDGRTDGRCVPAMKTGTLGGQPAVDDSVELRPDLCTDDPW